MINEVGHLPALGDSRRLIEGPMDAEINAALPVFLFGLGKGHERARLERAHEPGVINGDTIKFIRSESERDIVGVVVMAKALEERAAETGVS